MSERVDIDHLFSRAMEAREAAYAPYSGFAVGAALLDDRGRVFSGCNVENAAYPVGTCAEAGAIAAMAAAGGRRIMAIVVAAAGRTPVAPCGACRQRILEFARADTSVHMGDLSGIRASAQLSDLLPLAFGPETLPTADG